MGLVLANTTDNIINVDNTAGVTISAIISSLSAGNKLTKGGAGAGVLTLSGANTFSGDLTISTGTVSLTGGGTIASVPNIVLASATTLDVSAPTTALSLAAGQALKTGATGANTTATVKTASTKNLTLSAGGLFITAYGGGATAPLTVDGASAGALALNNAPVTVTTTSALTANTYKLVAKAGSASVTGTPGTLTVNGSGLAAGTTGALAVTSGELFLTVSVTATAPTVTTGTAGSITPNGAVVTGNNVTSDGGAALTQRGLAYSTSLNPTTADSKVIDGATTTGTYNSTISTLSPSTTYHVRAYAINSVGTSYGSDVSFATTAAAAGKMVVTLPGETFTNGVGNSGTVTAQTAGTPFNITTLTATLADGVTIDTSYSGAKTISYSGPSGSPTYTTSVSFTSGQSTTTLATTLTTAQTTTITASDGTLTGIASSSLLVNPGAINSYTVTGSSPQTAGTAFNVTVTARDANNNTVTTDNSTVVTMTSSGSTQFDSNGDTTFGDNTKILSSGTFTISAKDNKAESMTLTATDANTKTGTSSSITVNAGTATKIIVTLPGETFTSGTGNSGTVTAQTAGSSFAISKLSAVDNFNNINTGYSGAKTISYSGPGGVPIYTTAVTFASGQSTTTLTTTLTKAETTTITATDGTLTGVASSSLTVNAGAFTKLQLLMPGETAAAGSATGKTGTPSTRTAGNAFSVTVNGVDANWNVVSSVTDTVAITSSDANAALPANAALSSGTQAFSVTLKTAGSRTITATDSTDGLKTANTSPSTLVVADVFTKLQLIVPGETIAPGTASGKTGTPNAEQAGAAFNITVRAVDANWNLVNTVTDTTAITSTDGTATLPSNTALSAGTQTLSFTFNGTGSATITASDFTDNTKTANTSPSISITVLPRYQTKTSGNWSDFNTWQVDTGSGFVDAISGQTPSSADSTVRVLTGHTVTVTSGVTIDQTTVDAGGQITVNSGITLVIADGSGTDLTVNGIVNNAGTITPTGTILFGSGSKYQHNFTTTSGTIPASTWDVNSTVEFTAYTTNTSATGGIAQSFGNLTWNCTSQTGNLSMGGSLTTINGNLTVQSTGTGTFRFAANTSPTVTIGGNLSVSGGTLIPSTGTGSPIINVGANLTVSGGTLNTNLSTGAPTVNVAGNFTVSGAGSFTSSGGGLAAVNFNKASGTQTFTSTAAGIGIFAWNVGTGSTTNTLQMLSNFPMTASTSSSLSVLSGSTLDCGTFIVSGSTALFTLNSGGGIKTANVSGLGASITVTGAKTFSSGANYTYNANANQTIGAVTYSTANTVNNLIIANSGGAVFLGSNLTVSGILTVSAGANLDFNSLTVTTPNAPSLAGGLLMEVARTGANTFTGSKLTRTGGVLTYGGTLTASVVSGTLAAGDSIPLFVSAGGFGGGFTTVTGPTTPGGLTRDVSQLTGGTGGNITFKGTPTLSVTNSPVTYTGSPQSATVTSSAPGTVSDVKYDGSSTAPTNAGTYGVTADFTPTDTATYNSLNDASAGNFVIDKATPSVTVVVGSYTYNGSAQGPNSYTTNPTGDTGTPTWSYVGVSGTTYGPSATRPTNAGTYTAQVALGSDGNFNAASSSATAFTIATKAVTVTADSGQTKVKGTADPTFTYTVNTGDTLSGALSRTSLSETAGTYTITQGTVTNANNPNFSITYVSASFVIIGPIASADATTKPTNSSNIKIPLSLLTSNDSRIDSAGASHTDSLSVTAVANGATCTVSISGAFVLFHPDGTTNIDTFTYTLTDASSGATDTGTVTVTTSPAAKFDLQIVSQTAATYDGTDTSITVNFVGVPGQSYIIDYATTLAGGGNWTTYGTFPTGSTGSFAVTFTQPGDQTAAWNSAMFFRATK